MKTLLPILALAAVSFAGAAEVVATAGPNTQITRLSERDVMVQAASETATIELHFAGADRIDHGMFGELTISKSSGALRHYRPDVYQVIDGKMRPVRVSYKVKGKDRAEMNLGKFTKDAPIILRMGGATT